MAEFLSPGWIADLDAAAAADEALAETIADVDLIVEQHVVDADGSQGDVVYHVLLQRGRAAVRPGPAGSPTVRFTQDRATAEGIATGRLSAQRAFMAGRLQIGGDVHALVEHGPILAALGDTFASVRTDTFGEAAGDPARPGSGD